MSEIIDKTNTETNVINIEPHQIDMVPSLSSEEFQKSLIEKIIDSQTKEELQNHLDLFNLAQSKNNVLRVIKLNDLLQKVEDQAIERFNKRPDQISNRELLEYLQVVSTQIEKSQKTVNETMNEKPLIQITNNKNELNIQTGPTLNAESREKVIDAFSMIIKQLESLEDKKLNIENEPLAEEELDFSNKNDK